MRAVIAGGSGFLGNCLGDHLKEAGFEVVVLTRQEPAQHNGMRFVHWDGRTLGKWAAELEGADILVNLCGRSVDCRYTEANKKQIYQSRLAPTRVLGLCMLGLKCPPKVWINAASATIYRHAEDHPMTEQCGELGVGFSVDVCQQWERMFFSFRLPGVRKVAIRTGIVLGTEGSALQPLVQLTRLGLGGPHGKGTQMFTWLHYTDFCRAVHFIAEHPELEGAVNLCSPRPVPNAVLMKTIRTALGVRLALPLPVWLLRLGAVLIQTETELVLKSRWVLPQALMVNGFTFNYPSITEAINHLCAKHNERRHMPAY